MTHPARIVLYTNPDGNAAVLWINGEPVHYGTDAWHDTVRAINQATRDDAAPEAEQPAALTTLESFAPSPLNVHVDIVDLLNHCDGDEARAFDLIGKLKDLLA